MASVYSPCTHCEKLNRVLLKEGDLQRPICGNCKSELPLQGAFNELNASSLSSLLKKSPIPVVAYFWAPWCQPCKVFAPIFNQASKDLMEQAVFSKIDTQANPLAGDSFHIRGVPTLILFRNGFEIAREVGAMPLELFYKWIMNNIKLRAA